MGSAPSSSRCGAAPTAPRSIAWSDRQKKAPPAFTRAFFYAAEPPRRPLRGGTKDVETALFLSPVVRAPPADRPEVLSVLLFLSCAIFFVRLLLNLLYVCVQYILP